MYIQREQLAVRGRVKTREVSDSLCDGGEWVELHRLDEWKQGFFYELDESIMQDVIMLSRVIQSL